MVLFSCFIICYPIRRFIFLYHYNCTTKIVLSIVREQLPYKGNCPGGRGSCPISLEKDSNVIMKPDFNGIATFLFANIWLFLSFLSFNPRRLTNTLTHMHCNTLPLSTPLFLILSSLAVVLFLFASLTWTLWGLMNACAKICRLKKETMIIYLVGNIKNFLQR